MTEVRQNQVQYLLLTFIIITIVITDVGRIFKGMIHLVILILCRPGV